jgi:purine-binding chemotaxis protein CheW
MQICTFNLDDQQFGIDALQVQELIRHQPMTRVPMAPSSIRGLINLRGQIVTAIDLRNFLGLPPHPAESRLMNVVIRADENPISLLVDQIGDVLEVDQLTFEEPPESLSPMAKRLLHGTYKLEDRLLLFLNWQELVHATEQTCG